MEHSIPNELDFMNNIFNPGVQDIAGLVTKKTIDK